MRVVPAESWLVLLASLALSQAFRSKHLKDSMGNSLRYSWNGVEGVKVAITCKICGPSTVFLVWRKTCIDSKTNEPVDEAAKLTNSSRFTSKRIHADDFNCNGSSGGDGVVHLESTYSDRLPPEHTDCRVICCGYSKKTNAEPSVSEADQSVSNVSNVSVVVTKVQSLLLRPDHIWPKSLPYGDQRAAVLEAGECMDVNTDSIIELARNKTFYIQLIVLIMSLVTLFSVMATCLCVYLGDYKTNRRKSKQFREWVQRERTRRASLTSSGSLVKSGALRQMRSSRLMESYDLSDHQMAPTAAQAPAAAADDRAPRRHDPIVIGNKVNPTAELVSKQDATSRREAPLRKKGAAI